MLFCLSCLPESESPDGKFNLENEVITHEKEIDDELQKKNYIHRPTCQVNELFIVSEALRKYKHMIEAKHNDCFIKHFHLIQ